MKPITLIINTDYIHRGNKSQETLLAAQNERTLKRKRGGATQHMPRSHQKLH